jgi:hypothetical protein
LQLVEAPDEPYDGRTLYERLKEQRDLKKAELDEVKKMSASPSCILAVKNFVFLRQSSARSGERGDRLSRSSRRNETANDCKTQRRRGRCNQGDAREGKSIFGFKPPIGCLQSIIPIVEPIAPSTSTTAAVKRKFTDTKPMSKQAQLLSGVIKRARYGVAT